MAAAQKKKELDLDQQIEFLKKISFFQGFDDHELKQFLAVSKWLRVPPKTLIIKEGTTERAFYILVRGKVSVQKQTPTGPLKLTTLESGDCFGEMAMVTEIKRTADVMASTETFILRVEPDIVSTSNVFLQLKFYKRFCESLVTRLDFANKRMAGGKDVEKSDAQETLKLGTAKKSKPPRDKVAAKPRPKEEIKPPPPAKAIPPMPIREDRIGPSRLKKRIHPEDILPVNPAVAVELRKQLAGGNESDNTRKFADLIQLDPILSCRVIQTANSPYFRRASMVGTVPHAMVIVGIKQIQEVVADTIEASQDTVAFSGFTEVAKEYWRHAVMVGRIAELLKDVIRINTSTDVYLAGLFHDLGMLPLDTINPAFYPQFAREELDPALGDMMKAEKEFIGADHSQVGVWLGEGIGLPSAYLDVMRLHHQPEKANTSVAAVALVNLANYFASLRGVCLGKPEVTKETIVRSFAWVLIQEQHKPFLDVNVSQFVDSFCEELDKTWDSLTADLLL